MNWPGELWRRIANLFRRTRFDRELDEEMRLHKELREREQREAGANRDEARYASQQRFGNELMLREESREMWGWNWLEDLLQDARYGLRTLGKNRRFAAVAILTLGLGIGATTAVFSLFNTIYLGPLPFRNADRLIRLRDSTLAPDGRRVAYNNSARTALEIERDSHLFSGVAALDVQDMNLMGTQNTERVHVVGGSAGWMQVLGVQPSTGRMFSNDEERMGRDSGVAIISYGLWQTYFGGTPGILGREITLNDRTYTVVGTMPPGFRFPYLADVWIPERLDSADVLHEFAVFGRMRDTATVGQVRDEMVTVAQRIRQTYPDLHAGYGLEVRTLRQNLFEDQQRMSLVLAAVVGFLLAVACANIANLLLARSVVRQREFAIRSALGASGSRQVRQLLTESLILSGLGTACGLLLSQLFGKYLLLLIPTNITEQLGIRSVALDYRVMGFSIGIALLTGILAGLSPALRSRTRNLQDSLREGGRSGMGGLRNKRLLGSLVISEVAFAAVLLAGSALLLENLLRLEHRDLGLRASGLLTMEITPSDTRYTEGPKRSELARRIIERVKGVPGVSGASVLLVNPLGGTDWSAQAIVENSTVATAETPFIVNHQLAGPGVIGLMGMPLLAGREFTSQDTSQSPPVVIVSDSMARRFWPGQSPIGKRVKQGPASAGHPWRTVVGVVTDIGGEHEPDYPLETWYLPFEQEAGSRAAASFRLMVRGPQETANFATDVKNAVYLADGGVATDEMSYMDRYYSDSLASNRTVTTLVELFALTGLTLAAVGIHGVMSFAVSQRTHEIGLRLALGAQRFDVLTTVMGQGIGLALAGVAAGLLASFGVTRIVMSLMNGMAPADPMTFAYVAMMMVAVALVACFLPAWRATRVDPVIALRHE
ncbi:MAG: ABC transporter permease [Candidatus Acidiferrales bacterium]